MIFVLGMMASLVLFAFGWMLGYGSGYTLGEAHGRETGRAELPLTTGVRTSGCIINPLPVDLRPTLHFGPPEQWS